MSDTKIKILLVGTVGSQTDILQKKLESLQSSKAGPFDVCFCVGPYHPKETDVEEQLKFPLPVYLQDYQGKGVTASDDSAIVKLGHNLFYLRHEKAVETIHIQLPNHSNDLVVALSSKNLPFNDPKQSAVEQCDLLLSSDWPQGMEDVVNVDTEPLSFDVAQVALHCRPRYHIAPSSAQYHQSPPYALAQSEHVGRFLALAPVTPGKTNKTNKFIHALGLVPLSANPPPTTAPSTLPCPFLSPNNSSSMNQVSMQKPVPGFVAAAKASDAGAQYSRFATNRKRGRSDKEDEDPAMLGPPDDPSINTLFLYGLHKDVTGQLQQPSSGQDRILDAFSKFEPTNIRYPPNATTSTYCFLEFQDQKAALACLLDCQGRVSVDSVDLTLKLASGNKRSKNNHEQIEKHFVTQAEAPDSTTLYFHPPKTTESDDHFANTICKYLQQTLEEALNEGNEDERITAETEPALKVEVRLKDNYGFLEFASHAAATMALAAVTKSTDGGLVQESESPTPPQPAYLIGTTLRWAKGEPPKSKRQEVLEALGLERQYFERDNRTDCWFCLASPTCETHLITGVYKEWYACMPKGPMHPGHVLLVPVTHTSKGAWTLGSSEWTILLDQFTQHASQVYDCDLFIFERAIATKGGYHSHVNVVPIPRKESDTAIQLQSTMMAHAKASGFDLRAIQSDLGMQALVDDSESQYFYAEIRSKGQSHRFVYHHVQQNAPSNVPLQFAREVLAAVMHNPKLAHWKSCVLDKDQEAELAKDFRESFSKITS